VVQINKIETKVTEVKDKEVEITEEDKEDLLFKKKSFQKQKSKNKLEKHLKNFKGNLTKVKELNIEGRKEMRTVSKQKLICKLQQQRVKY